MTESGEAMPATGGHGVAVVTGASCDVGAYIVAELADAGFRVAAVAHTVASTPGTEGSLAETVAAVRARGGRVEAILSDLSEPADRVGLIAAIEDRMGPAEVLVNNAVLPCHVPLADLSRRQMGRLLEINVSAPVELVGQAGRSMRQRGRGWIVNASSVAATAPEDAACHSLPLTAYGVTKAALDRLTLRAAVDLRDWSIAVNSLSPVAAVATPGAIARGTIDPESPDAEPPELMARATRVLATCDPSTTGGMFLTRPLLETAGR